MKITQHCIDSLNQLRSLLDRLDDSTYRYPSRFLHGATIGQHIRHILEFYQCLLSPNQFELVDYDARKRTPEIEQVRSEAICLLDSIVTGLYDIHQDRPMGLSVNHGLSSQSKAQEVGTTLFRELAYNLEHTIHHEALIKVVLGEVEHEDLVDEKFGIAPATIRNRSAMAQLSS